MTEWTLTVTGLPQVMQRFSLAHQIVGQALTQVLTRRLAEGVQYAQQRYLSGGTTSDRLAERSGRLKASFGSEVAGTGRQVVGRIGYLHNAPPWAAVHEGWPNRASTTNRPRRGQYLAIPLTAEARQASPRAFAETFVGRSRRGALLIFQKTAAGIEPLYLLRSEVIIPARPALRPTVARFMPFIMDDLRKAISQGLGGA